MSEAGENTPEKLQKKSRRGNPANLAPAWKPGQSGNPEGRPKGARSKFGEAFVLDYLEDWQQNGKQSIEELRAKDVEAYVRVGCVILPKVVELDDDTKDILAAVAGAQIDFAKIRAKLDKK